MNELMLKIVAKSPLTGAPTRILARRDFSTMADLKITMNNLISKAKNVKIIYAGKVHKRDGVVIDARVRFCNAGEVWLGDDGDPSMRLRY